MKHGSPRRPGFHPESNGDPERSSGFPEAAHDDLGTIWIIEIDADENLWTASWERGSDGENFHGSREDTIAWAQARTATKRFIHHGEDGWEQLPPR